MPDEAAVRPGGLAFIRLEYTDREGIWKPMERHTLSVTVKNGTLSGLGNACPYRKGSLAGSTTETFFGDALAVVRADGRGDVIITAADETKEYVLQLPCRKETE